MHLKTEYFTLDKVKYSTKKQPWDDQGHLHKGHVGSTSALIQGNPPAVCRAELYTSHDMPQRRTEMRNRQEENMHGPHQNRPSGNCIGHDLKASFCFGAAPSSVLWKDCAVPTGTWVICTRTNLKPPLRADTTVSRLRGWSSPVKKSTIHVGKETPRAARGQGIQSWWAHSSFLFILPKLMSA